MFLIYLLIVYGNIDVKSYDFYNVTITNDDKKYLIKNDGTLGDIDKDEKLSKLIFVMSKRSKVGYAFGLMNYDGKLIGPDTENSNELKLLPLDEKFRAAAICNASEGSDEFKCKDIKKPKEEEEAEEEEESKEQTKEKEQDEEKGLNFYLRYNDANAPGIGILDTKQCLTIDKEKLKLESCPKPGEGGPKYGWNLYLKPKNVAQEEKKYMIKNLEIYNKLHSVSPIKKHKKINFIKQFSKSNKNPELEKLKAFEMFQNVYDPKLVERSIRQESQHNPSLYETVIGEEETRTPVNPQTEGTPSNPSEEIVENVGDTPADPQQTGEYSKKAPNFLNFLQDIINVNGRRYAPLDPEAQSIQVGSEPEIKQQGFFSRFPKHVKNYLRQQIVN